MAEIAPELQRALSDRYRIERELGRGGMSVVYLAEDLKHSRRVALKVLAPELGQALGSERFLREIRIAAKLSHPRIVPVLDSGSAAGHLFYVMPYVDGESLRSRLDREGQLPLDEALEIARQVAGALSYAHEQDIVHRDIKPENILLSGGEAVVADFGIARAFTVAGGTRLTGTGLVVGTPLYMSPEQASSGGDADARSDLYSLACVLYEMLAGEPPFEAKTAHAITARRLTESAPDVRAVRELVPAAVAGAISRGLARLPADRYRSAEEFSEVLRRAGSEPAAPAAVPASDQGSNVWRIATLVCAALLLLVGIAHLTGWLSRDRGVPPGLWVERPVEGFVDIGRRAALSPDGRRVAYLNRDRLWMRELGGLESRPVPGTDGARLPFWSPDGSEVGYVAGGRLWRVPAAGGQSVLIAALGVGLAGGSGVTWTEAGDIVFGTGSTGLMTVPARGGVPRLLVPLAPGEDDHHEPFALPGGRGILFVPHRHDGADAVEVLVDGDRRELLQIAGQSLRDPVYSDTGHILFSRPGGIWAVPFSLRRLEVTGEPFLVRSGAAGPSVGTGGVLAFVHQPGASAGRQLAFVRSDGQLDGLVGDPAAWNGYFDISPSGREIAIALSDPDGIWILDPETGSRSRPSVEGEGGNFPRWSPDGTHIAYWGRTADEEPAVLLRRADGTGSAREIARAWYPSFTPDGRGMLMTLGTPTPDDDWHVGYLDLNEGGDPVALVGTSAWECCQHLSPDGGYLAYASNTTGRWEVYVTRFPSAEGTWRVSSEGGSWPRWDPGGGRLFYAQDVNIMAVPVSTEPSLSLGEPEVLFSRPGRVMDIRFGKPDYYDVTPDGDRFLVVLPGGNDDGEQHTVVVTGDWRAAMERR